MLQTKPGMLRGAPAAVQRAAAKLIDHFGGGIHTQIRQDQSFLQFIKEIIIDFIGAGEDFFQCIAQGLSGFGQTGLDLIKKSHDCYSFIRVF